MTCSAVDLWQVCVDVSHVGEYSMGLQYSWKSPRLREPSVSAVSMSLSCRGCWDCRVDALVCFFSAFLVRLMQVMTGLFPLPLDSVKLCKNEPIRMMQLYYLLCKENYYLGSHLQFLCCFSTPLWHFDTPFSLPPVSGSSSVYLAPHLHSLTSWSEMKRHWVIKYSMWGRSEMLRTVDLSQSASRSPHTIFYILLGIVGNTKALPSGSDLIISLSKNAFLHWHLNSS